MPIFTGSSASAYFTEFVVIVVSALLAFQIEEWRDRRWLKLVYEAVDVHTDVWADLRRRCIVQEQIANLLGSDRSGGW